MKTGILDIWAFILLIAFIAGEIMCIVKAVRCDWEEPYKAEIIYTVSAITGFGCIVGWIDIEDN